LRQIQGTGAASKDNHRKRDALHLGSGDQEHRAENRRYGSNDATAGITNDIGQFVRLKGVERVGGCAQMWAREVQIDCGLFEIAVTEQNLDWVEIFSG